MTTTQANPRQADSNGYAPGLVQECTEGCLTCAGLGWILCDHEGAEIEADPLNADGHDEWCLRCSSPTDGRTWTWCTARPL